MQIWNNRAQPARQPASTTMTIGNREVRVALDLNIPVDAWLQLFDLDLPAAPGGTLVWDTGAQTWGLR